MDNLLERKTGVGISVPIRLLIELDTLAGKMKITRSELVCIAIKEFLEKKQ